jgi:hypothetical protein
MFLMGQLLMVGMYLDYLFLSLYHLIGWTYVIGLPLAQNAVQSHYRMYCLYAIHFNKTLNSSWRGHLDVSLFFWSISSTLNHILCNYWNICSSPHASLEPLYYGFVSKVSSMRGNYEKKKGGPGVDTTFFGRSLQGDHVMTERCLYCLLLLSCDGCMKSDCLPWSCRWLWPVHQRGYQDNQEWYLLRRHIVVLIYYFPPCLSDLCFFIPIR